VFESALRVDTAEAGAATAARLCFDEWLHDDDLAGVRDPDEIAKLPESERAPWTALWDEVRKALAAVKAGT